MRKYFKKAAYLFMATLISNAHAGSYEEFFKAVNRDDGATVRGLLQHGLDPNSRSPEGQTGLHLALRDRSPQVAEALWASQALDVNALNANGESALMIAALRGNLAWARRLIERGAKTHKEGWSPIHYAATGPESKLVALLLDRGAPIDATSPNRSTPLMMAARYGAEASVDLLLARGANKALRNDVDLSAGDFAKLGGREFLLQRLNVAPK